MDFSQLEQRGNAAAFSLTELRHPGVELRLMEHVNPKADSGSESEAASGQRSQSWREQRCCSQSRVDHCC